MVFKWFKGDTKKESKKNIESLDEKTSEGISCPEKDSVTITQADTHTIDGVSDEDISHSVNEILDIVDKDTVSDSTPLEDTEKGFFSRLTQGLLKSSTKLNDSITGVFTKRKLDLQAIEDLQDILITSDMGVESAKRFADNIAQNRFDKEVSDDEIKEALSHEIEKELESVCIPLEIQPDTKPYVIMMVGVNGSGKTTTIGKLAQKFKNDNKKVMVAAGDTFRAAAVAQLSVWAKRTGVEFFAKEDGADAGALAYEAVQKAIDNAMDVLLIDTAGRLHNKVHLMDELKKVDRVIKKLIPEAPHDCVIVLDGTVGQNAIEQVSHFMEAVKVSGVIMTKLDGSAKGGILVNIAHRFHLPIHAVGVGESVQDLDTFNAKDFSISLVGK